jgi:hypothetical protein
MISREEYNKALDIVEAYHKQLFLSGVGSSLRTVGKTRLYEWDKIHLCSIRLHNVLKNAYDYENKYGSEIYYIENLTFEKFKRIRNAGKKCWEDFVKVRGY